MKKMLGFLGLFMLIGAAKALAEPVTATLAGIGLTGSNLAMLGGGALAGLGGWLGGKSSKGKVGTTAPQWLQNPQWDWYEDSQRQASDFISSNIQSMSEGKFPSYFEKASPYIKENMLRGVQESFYGSPMGGPGIYEDIRAQGAAAGIGPSAMMANTLKAGKEYANKYQEVTEYIQKLGVGIMQNDAANFTRLAQTQSAGPPGQWQAGSSYNIPPDTTMQDSWGNIMQALPMLMNKDDDDGTSGGGGATGSFQSMSDISADMFNAPGPDPMQTNYGSDWYNSGNYTGESGYGSTGSWQQPSPQAQFSNYIDRVGSQQNVSQAFDQANVAGQYWGGINNAINWWTGQ